MSRRARFAVLTLGAVAVAAAPFWPAAAQRSAEEVRSVLVVNFPRSQQVEGTVTIGSPVPQAALASLKEVNVPPVLPRDTGHLIDGGTIATDGFGAVVLSLAGQTRGEILRSGSVGAILLPDEPAILHVLEEKGEIQFPLEVIGSAMAGAPYFASTQPRYVVAFPRYRVLFYNTTDKTVTVTLYAYLTN